MSRYRTRLLVLIGVMLSVGCAGPTPASRLAQYVPISRPGDSALTRLPDQRPVRATLVLIADRSESEAPPLLPEVVQERLAEKLREDINRGFPIVIERVVQLGEIPAGGAKLDWRTVAGQQGAEYLVVAVLSGVEQEYPVSLFLGWTTHRQPGVRRDHWALVEAALIEGRSGRVVLQAEGRAWATLHRPTAPGISQWYPVIYLRPQDPERRIWPSNYEVAPVTLQVVATERAAKRLADNLQRAWVERRDVELASMSR